MRTPKRSSQSLRATKKRVPPKTTAGSGKRKRSKTPSYFKCPQCLSYLPIEKKKSHFCVKPQESDLLAVLTPEAREAWDLLRAFACGLGEQRVYASNKAIMFARRICYFFVRPKPKGLELTLFVDHRIQHPSIKRVLDYSKTKHAHVVQVVHVDQIEEPLTDWLREAWDLAE